MKRLVFLVLFIATTAYGQDEFKGIFTPLPALPELSTLKPAEQAKIALGKKLYNDPILSISKKISCNSCHKLDAYGVDGEPTSPGHEGKRGDRNSPTVYNSFLQFKQFWDGRAADVEAQALGPVLNPAEMAMPAEDVVIERLTATPEYTEMFNKAFPDDALPITFKNMGRAIGAFERRLVTRGKFDKYLEGDSAALTDVEKAGLKSFVSSGCIACHAGVGVGGLMFQKLGLVKSYDTKDLGLFTQTKKEADKFFFKVPTLRNVSETGPYFHDGSVKTLNEAITLMGRHQLGRELPQAEVESIAAFLHALKGEIPKEAL